MELSEILGRSGHDPRALKDLGLTKLDPQTLKMLELYFGGQQRMPSPVPKRMDPTKPIHKLAPRTISADDVMASGGRRVEAEDIAMHFNNALASGLGYKAFQAIPPELRDALLRRVTPQKEPKKEKPEVRKLPKPDQYARDTLGNALAKSPSIKNKVLADMLLESEFEGNRVLSPQERALAPQIDEVMRRLYGTTDTVRDSASAGVPVKRTPTERYYQIVNENTPDGPRSRYQLAEREKLMPRQKAPEDRTYWDESQIQAGRGGLGPQSGFEVPWMEAPPPSPVPAREAPYPFDPERAAELNRQPAGLGNLAAFLRKLGLVLPGDPEAMVSPGRAEYGIPRPNRYNF